MPRKSSTDSRATRARSAKVSKSDVPQPLQVIAGSPRGKKIKIPKLILAGEWLKAIGFPVGAPLHLVCDRRGELMLHRLGLRLPRTLRIVAKCQRPNAIRVTAGRGARR